MNARDAAGRWRPWSKTKYPGRAGRRSLGGKEAALHPTDEELVAYADGTLGASDRKRLRGHLLDCRKCMQELERAHHLSDERIARYIHGSLHGSLLARTDKHLRECGLCRWYKEGVEETRRFRDTGTPAAEGEEIPAHLTEAEVYAYIWGVLDDEDQEQVEAHLGGIRGCMPCTRKIGEAIAERAIGDLMGNAETRELIEGRMKGGRNRSLISRVGCRQP